MRYAVNLFSKIKINNTKARFLAKRASRWELALGNMPDYDRIAVIVNEILNKRMDEGRMKTAGGMRIISEP